ncbi:uncharacterized protein [Drosophila kikkawai]|uniref:Uncharacterized protein LOC108080781 n=1 Tax=Drosophila kikkawai TaxID=30033 RepID=A0A6P4J6Y1_DROKI|nr:uncharacterized protein LOC108080781 [Drosophila kikkawai]XP_041630285.1 uncharacterized protein LOC108080781 [Drosophila kikkawai]
MSPKTIAVLVLVLWINSFELTAVLGGGYQLNLTHPDGSATRRESVVVDPEGNAQVDGEIRQIFSGPHEGSLVILYKTGPEGYRIRYTYAAGAENSLTSSKNETFSIKRLGPNALKSSVG